MANYVKSFGPDFVGLTGSPEAIAAAAKAYRVAYSKVENKESTGRLQRSIIRHSSILWTQNGRYVTHFAYGIPRRQMAEKLAQLPIDARPISHPRPSAIAPQHKITISVCDAALLLHPVRAGGRSMLYHLYELNQAALEPGTGGGRSLSAAVPQSAEPGLAHAARPGRCCGARAVRAHHAALPQAGLGHPPTPLSRGRRSPSGTRRIIASHSAISSISSGTSPLARRRKDRKLLIVAPMAGHFPTLLRGTVRDMLPAPRGLHHRVAGRAPRAAVRRLLRPRRLHRLCH